MRHEQNAGVMGNGTNEDLRQKVAALIANLSVEQDTVRAELCSEVVSLSLSLSLSGMRACTRTRTLSHNYPRASHSTSRT